MGTSSTAPTGTAAKPPKRRRRAGSMPLKPLGQMRFAPSFGTPTPPLSRLPCETGCIRQIEWSSTTVEWICRTTAMWYLAHLFWRNNKSIKKTAPVGPLTARAVFFWDHIRGKGRCPQKPQGTLRPPQKGEYELIAGICFIKSNSSCLSYPYTNPPHPFCQAIL